MICRDTSPWLVLLYCTESRRIRQSCSSSSIITVSFSSYTHDTGLYSLTCTRDPLFIYTLWCQGTIRQHTTRLQRIHPTTNLQNPQRFCSLLIRYITMTDSEQYSALAMRMPPSQYTSIQSSYSTNDSPDYFTPKRLFMLFSWLQMH